MEIKKSTIEWTVVNSKTLNIEEENKNLSGFHSGSVRKHGETPDSLFLKLGAVLQADLLAVLRLRGENT